MVKNFHSNKLLFNIFFLIALFSLLWSLFILTDPLSAFLIIFSILFTIFTFLRPFYGLLLLVFLRPTLDIFTSKSIIAFGEYYLNTASLLAILAIALSVSIIFRNLNELKKLPLKSPIILFILLTFISIFYSFNFATSVAEWLRILSIFFLYILSFVLIKNKYNFNKLVYTIIASTIIPGFMSLYQFFTKTGMTIIDEDITNRIFGTFAHPNLLAYYLTIPLALLVFLVLKKDANYIKKILIYSLLLFNFIILLLTFTRGAWVAFLIILLIFGTVKYRKFLAISILGLFLIYMLLPPLSARVNNLFVYNPYSSIQWRINIWKDGFKYAQENIIAGHGLGTAKEIILNKRGERFGSADPHNDYLKIFIENGILGVISYIAIIVSLIFTLMKKYMKTKSDSAKILFLLFIGISSALYFMSFADNVIRNTALQWTFWILLGAMFSFHQKNLSKQN